MDVYKSKNSEYYIKDGNLIRERNRKKESLGKKFVYISTKDLVSISKEKNIKLNEVKTLETTIGDEFMAVLEDKDMDLNKTNGRFFVLQEGLEDYLIFCSGEIIEKKEYGAKIGLANESELDLDLDLDDDKELNK